MPPIFDKMSTQGSLVHVAAVGLALLASVGVADYLLGYEISLSVLYLAPVIYVTWYGKAWAGYAICWACALVWFYADYAAGHPYSTELIPVWNTGVRLGTLTVTAYLVNNIKGQLTRMAQLAVTDSLTGLMNGRAFRNGARQLLDLAARRQQPVADRLHRHRRFQGRQR